MALTTSTMIVMGVMAAGAGVSAYASYEQGQTAKKVSKRNAEAMERSAKNEELESREQSRRERVHNRRSQARQRAMIAKSGVIETGSPLEVMAEDAGRLELRVLDQRRTSRMQQESMKSGASLERFSGRQAARAGSIQAGASLLQGFGQAGAFKANAPAKPKAGP